MITTVFELAFGLHETFPQTLGVGLSITHYTLFPPIVSSISDFSIVVSALASWKPVTTIPSPEISFPPRHAFTHFSLEKFILFTYYHLFSPNPVSSSSNAEVKTLGVVTISFTRATAEDGDSFLLRGEESPNPSNYSPLDAAPF
ncbi:hypothetical protein VNO77_02923 [Canavalia gladiata]|uniref:Uncharacterized protein n=1 Tax=Canavalia gladiata TaxID=3824 RepID=A0AAN9R3F4_CANGL